MRINAPPKILFALLLLLDGLVVRALAANPIPPRTEELRAGLSRIIKSIETGDETPFNEALDRTSAIKDAFDSLDPAETGFMDAARNAVENIGREYVRKTNPCGRSKIVRVKPGEESVFALVRFDYGDAGWGWVDMELAHGLDGRLRIVDLIDYRTGLDLVDTLRREAAPYLTQPASLEKIFGLTGLTPENAQKLMEILAHLREHEPISAMADFKRLDGVSVQNKLLIHLGLWCALNSADWITYGKLLEALGKLKGRDPAVSLLLAQQALIKEQYQDALGYFEAFSKIAGEGEATLLSSRAEILMNLDRIDEGLKLAKKAMAAERSVADGFWAAFMGEVALGHFDQAVALGKTLEKEFDFRFDEEELGKNELFLKFVKSREFANWQETGE